jgi:hypothetical protein
MQTGQIATLYKFTHLHQASQVEKPKVNEVNVAHVFPGDVRPVDVLEKFHVNCDDHNNKVSDGEKNVNS